MALISIDESKVKAIRNWPIPTTVKEALQTSNGASFSTSATFNLSPPRKAQISVLVRYSKLSVVLRAWSHPDKPVEVDASTTGVGAVL